MNDYNRNECNPCRPFNYFRNENPCRPVNQCIPTNSHPSCCPICLPGPPGATGAKGARGAKGAAGPAGPAGPSALSAFGYIYSTEEQTLDKGDLVVFNSPNIVGAIVFNTNDNFITLTAEGNYRVSFQVSSGSGGGNVWAIEVDNAVLQPFSFMSRSGNTQIFGEFIINVTDAPVVLTLVNEAGNNVKIVNGLASDPNTSVSASVVILKLS